MRFSTGHHRFYCGIDLHARQMYVCILDTAGELLHVIAPCTGKDVVLAVKGVFPW